MRDLYCMMDEEVDGALEYAKMAFSYKDSMPALSKAFDQMASDEMRHANMIEAEINKVVEGEKKNPASTEVGMTAIFDFMHERYTEKLARARVYQSKAKGG